MLFYADCLTKLNKKAIFETENCLLNYKGKGLFTINLIRGKRLWQ